MCTSLTSDQVILFSVTVVPAAASLYAYILASCDGTDQTTSLSTSTTGSKILTVSPIKFVLTKQVTVSSPPSNGSSGLSSSVIGGIVAAVVISFISTVAILAFFCYKLKARKLANDGSHTMGESMLNRGLDDAVPGGRLDPATSEVH